MSAIRIAIVDDQTIIREGLAALLALISDLEVVGMAGDGQAGVELVAERKPDVVLRCIRLSAQERRPGVSGWSDPHRLRWRCHSEPKGVIVFHSVSRKQHGAFPAGGSGTRPVRLQESRP